MQLYSSFSEFKKGLVNSLLMSLLFLFAIGQELAAQAYAYIPNWGDDNVSVIDFTTNTVIATIPVGDKPESIGFNMDGTKAYVTSATPLDNISVIDIATNTVETTITVGGTPKRIVVGNEKAYTADLTTGKVYVIDLASNTMVDSIISWEGNTDIALSPDESKLYVIHLNNISAYNTTTHELEFSNSGAANAPNDLLVSPDGLTLYVADIFGDEVKVFDAITGLLITSIPTGMWPSRLALSDDGSKLYVSIRFDGEMSVINTTTNTIEATVAVGDNPRGIALSNDDQQVYVVNSYSNDLSVINTATNMVTSTITVGDTPIAIGDFTTGLAPSNIDVDDPVIFQTLGDIFPNPSAIGQAQIEYTATVPLVLSLRIYSTIGQLMQQQKIELIGGTQLLDIQFNSLPNGIYWVQFENGNEAVYRRLIVNR